MLNALKYAWSTRAFSSFLIRLTFCDDGNDDDVSFNDRFFAKMRKWKKTIQIKNADRRNAFFCRVFRVMSTCNKFHSNAVEWICFRLYFFVCQQFIRFRFSQAQMLTRQACLFLDKICQFVQMQFIIETRLRRHLRTNKHLHRYFVRLNPNRQSISFST